jgi:hypothetical protein
MNIFYKKTSTLHNFIPDEHILLKTKDEMKTTIMYEGEV